MKIAFMRFIRDSLSSAKSYEKRRNALSKVKAAQTIFSGVGLVTTGMALLDFYEGRLRTFFFLPLAYGLGVEGKAIADNVREILENPIKELWVGCTRLRSDKKLWTIITHGAPLTQKIGLIYMNYIRTKTESEPSHSFFSKFWRKKENLDKASR